MAKESYYFSHDHNARNDRKLMRVQMEMGMEGIGLFWCITEMLHEENGYLMLSECERIAFELRTPIERVTRLINDYELFITDEKRLWSESALLRIEKRKEKSEKAAKSAQTRWKAPQANAMRTHSEGNAIKERKGKEKKGNESIRGANSAELLPLVVDEKVLPMNVQFEKCWSMYERYGSKKKALDYWQKHSQEDRDAIEATIPQYVASTPGCEYRKHFEGWINPDNRLWERPIRVKQERRIAAGDLNHNGHTIGKF